MPKKILLIDVSNLFFRAFFAIPRNLTSGDGEPINAVFGVASMILSLLESQRPDYVFGAKDEKGKTKRHEMVEEYKGHRPEMPSDLASQLPKIFEIFGSYNIPLHSLPGYEADDVLATISEKYRGDSDFTVEIVSGDHDTFQLAEGNVCVACPQNGGKAPTCMHRAEIYEKLGVFPEQVADYKALVGDPSDNLKGVDGVGKKTAAKLLQEFDTLENIFENLEKIPGKLQEKLREGQEKALFTKGIATLHRDLEFEFDLEKGNVRNIAFGPLEQFFRRYQFHSLLNRLPKVRTRLENPQEADEHDALWKEFEEAEKKSFAEVQKQREVENVQEQMNLF